MNAKIINGKYLSQQILDKITQQVELIKLSDKPIPKLAIILIGNNPASEIYVANKLKAARIVGVDTVKIHLPKTINTDRILLEIHKLNNDSAVSGIIIQLPIPMHIDAKATLCAIDPKKDVDGFHPINVGYLHNQLSDGFVPCTALGCITLIKNCSTILSGKIAVIVGRSNIVGKPLSALLLQENCTVIITHSKTRNLSYITQQADIVISAVGSAGLLTSEYFQNNAIVIDIGISRNPYSKKIVGDVDFDNVSKKVNYITPVPGGVGPMTVACLLQNTIKAYLNL